MAEGAYQDNTSLGQRSNWPHEILEDVPEDAIQVPQQPILSPDHHHAGIPPVGGNKGREVVVREHHTDRFKGVRQDSVLVRTGDADHSFRIEGHADVQFVLQTVEVLHSQVP